jgi:hypothetical protein
MAYLSPLHIIKGISGDDAFEVNDNNLIRLRKRLLAELNLSGETTITINKRSYSKDEIIKTIDQILGNPDIALHDFIFKHSFLLRYLEDESMVLHPHTYSELAIPTWLQDGLDAVLCERFIIQFKKGISSRAFTHAQHAIALMNKLPDGPKMMCYEEAHKSLHTLNTFLYELENALTLSNKREIQFLGFDSFANFLNALPSEFEGIKYDLVNRAINMVVAYHKMNRHDKELVVDISTVLTKITCDDDQAILILSNHKVFTSRTRSSSSSSSSSEYGYLRYIGIAAIILFNIFRVCNKSSSHDYSPGYNYPSVPDLYIPTAQAFTPADELQLYRSEISERLKKNNEILTGAMFDTLYGAEKDPFLYGFKQGKDSALSKWNKNLEITNKSNYDLIVFTYDSAKTAVSPTYIRQHESESVQFANQNRFVFYFGNTLLRAKKISEFGERIPGYYEHFKHNEQTALLSTTYKISLKQAKAKNKNDYRLKVDSAFIENRSDTIRLKKFSLSVTED